MSVLICGKRGFVAGAVTLGMLVLAPGLEAQNAAKAKTPAPAATKADAPDMGEFVNPLPDEKVDGALADIQSKLGNIKSMTATLAMDRKHKDKKKKQIPGSLNDLGEKAGRRIKKGPLELIRGAGARLVVSRRETHEFYVANATDLWSYDVGDDEAKRIPTRLPIIKPFVQNAFSLNAAASMQEGTIKLRGSQTVDGVDCWVLSGKTPESLEMAGLESTGIGFWVGKADGVPRRIVVPDAEDAIITLRNIKLNVPIDPSRFVWTPPAGVKEVGILGF